MISPVVLSEMSPWIRYKLVEQNQIDLIGAHDCCCGYSLIFKLKIKMVTLKTHFIIYNLVKDATVSILINLLGAKIY